MPFSLNALIYFYVFLCVFYGTSQFGLNSLRVFGVNVIKSKRSFGPASKNNSHTLSSAEIICGFCICAIKYKMFKLIYKAHIKKNKFDQSATKYNRVLRKTISINAPR